MANPDLIFQDGFDHYANQGDGTRIIDTQIGYEYAVTGSGQFQLDTALSGTGNALVVVRTGVAQAFLNHSLSANFARCIGGFTIKPSVSIAFQGIQLWDSATQQISIGMNASGQCVVLRGGPAGTVIATSVEVGTPGQVHYVAYDVTVHNSTGIIKVWLNNLLTTINLTGQDTAATANNFFNGVGPGINSGANIGFPIDHTFYFCYTASGGTEVPPLTSPVIETQFGSSDSSKQFTQTAAVLGNDLSATNTTNAPGANQLVLRKFTPAVNMTLNSVGLVPAATSATVKFKAVFYADSAGSPAALTTTGTEVVGCTSGTVLALPFGAGQALTGGTSYWIGYITDTSIAIQQDDTTTLGQKKANTYTSGAPNPAGAMTSGQASWLIWGNCSGAASNYVATNRHYVTPRSYNSDSVVGHKDMFNFPALSGTPVSIYAVTVRAAMSKSDGGARTVNLKTDSGGTLSNGSAPGLSPPLSISYQSSNWLLDPNTGLAWTSAGVNAAKGGYEIAS
jgi:hypothetical protein